VDGEQGLQLRETDLQRAGAIKGIGFHEGSFNPF
jgi:hypothetical protein